MRSLILFCISAFKLLARGAPGPGRARALAVGPRGAEEADMVGAELFGGFRRVGGWETSEEVLLVDVESAGVVWFCTPDVVD